MEQCYEIEKVLDKKFSNYNEALRFIASEEMDNYEVENSIISIIYKGEGESKVMLKVKFNHNGKLVEKLL